MVDLVLLASPELGLERSVDLIFSCAQTRGMKISTKNLSTMSFQKLKPVCDLSKLQFTAAGQEVEVPWSDNDE